MQTPKNCLGSSALTPLSSACSVSLLLPSQTHAEKTGGGYSDIHKSFAGTASVYVFCD